LAALKGCATAGNVGRVHGIWHAAGPKDPPYTTRPQTTTDTANTTMYISSVVSVVVNVQAERRPGPVDPARGGSKDPPYAQRRFGSL
jgi:hypothetical protein